MGILDRMRREARSLENPSVPLTDSRVREWFGAEDTPAGPAMTPEQAMRLTAVWACHNILGDSGVGRLPIHIHERLPNGASRVASDHPLWSLVHDRPNPELPNNEFFALGTHHMLGWGGAFFEIQRTEDQSRVLGLWPLLPSRTKAHRKNGEKLYRTHLPSGEPVDLPARKVLHVPALGFDGLNGYAPLTHFRRNLGLYSAAEEFGSRFFGQGLNASGFLMHPQTISEPAQVRLEQNVERQTGLTNAHRVMLLEEGMKFEQRMIAPDDAQFLETRKFSVQDVARIYQVPPHMLADTDRPFQSNVEAMGIEFVVYSLGRWLIRWEKRLQELLPEAERAKLFFRFKVDGLLRGDKKTRMEAYRVARQGGWMTANEILRLEDMNPIEGEYGDAYLVQSNQSLVMPSGEIRPLIPQQQGASSRDLPEWNGSWIYEPEHHARHPERRIERRALPPRVRLRDAFLPVFRRDAERLVTGETRALKRAVEDVLLGSGREAFAQWVQDYYGDRTRGFIADTLRGSLMAMLTAVAREALTETEFSVPDDQLAASMEALGGEYLDVFASRYIGSSRGQVEKLGSEFEDVEEFAAALTTRFDEWKEKRPDKVASNESTRIGGVGALYAFAAAGVTRIVWRNVSKSCPLCLSLEGSTVEIHTAFVRPGDVVSGAGQTTDLQVKQFVKHPPLHGGCDCFIVPG